MNRLFTVRWPLFARLEAALLFPVACSMAGEIAPLRTYIAQQLVAPLAPLGMPLGIQNQAIFWAGVAIATFVPYFFLLVVVDRFLTVRKGFAILSAAAIAIWSVVAKRSPWLVAQYLPEPFLHEVHWLSFTQKAVITLGGLALLLHLKALWAGLRDHGQVAEELIAAGEAYPYRAGANAQDVYRWQTADFRGWQIQLEGLGGGPKEHPVVQFLYGIAWVGATVGGGAAYLAWYGFPGFGPGLRYHEPAPVVEVGPVRPGGSPKSVTPPVTQAIRPAPASPPPGEHVVAIAPPLPAVQRPTGISASVQAGDGANEAIARRGNDGSFAFDAVVNGTHVRMLFDTGASVVGLRAEDAERLGIPVDSLTYSAKIKTANGSADVAPVNIDTMVVGNITLRNVAGFVAKEGMLQQNLLGQTFLGRLSGFDVENNVLVLRGR
jgi:clan AA aspartic protease (TIGR02281 family)